MSKLVYLTYPAVLIILFAGSKWYKKGEWNEEFMSLEQTKYIQGFLAICIMLHHIGQETCAPWQNYKLLPGLEFFVPIGYLMVSMFFMFSGFGLYKSFSSKDNYLVGFFRKRMLPLILAFLFSNWIYFIARIIMHEKINGWKIFCYITGYGLPNLYAWFALVMPLFYLFFYVAFKWLKTDKARISCVIILTFIYTFIGTWIDHNDYWMRGEWWYNSVHLFWIGILFAKYEKDIVAKFRKVHTLAVIISAICLLVSYNLSEIFKGVFSYYGEYNRSLSHWQVVENRWICLIGEMLVCIFFVLLFMLLNMKIKLGNKFLGFMGGITLEFYLIHGLFLEFFSYRFCEIVPSIVRIKNVALLIVIVFALSIPASLGFKKMIYIGNKKKRSGK